MKSIYLKRLRTISIPKSYIIFFTEIYFYNLSCVSKKKSDHWTLFFGSFIFKIYLEFLFYLQFKRIWK